MPTLIHLNGPPGAGKSTLARRYTDDHPGVLDLDIDTLVPLIGGWRDDFFGVLPAARSLAIAMAETHLRGGADVVMPQLVTSHSEAARFESVADRTGAQYLEVVLSADPEEQARRFHSRSHPTEVTAHIRRVVAEQGGDAMLGRIRCHLDDYLAQRPHVVHLDTANTDPGAAYALLRTALSGRRPSGSR